MHFRWDKTQQENVQIKNSMPALGPKRRSVSSSTATVQLQNKKGVIAVEPNRFRKSMGNVCGSQLQLLQHSATFISAEIVS